KKSDDLAVTPGQAQVPGCRLTGVRLVGVVDGRFIRLKSFPRVIGGTIVDDHDLHPTSKTVLVQNTLHGVADEGAVVVGSDENRDSWPLARRGTPPAPAAVHALTLSHSRSRSTS